MAEEQTKLMADLRACFYTLPPHQHPKPKPLTNMWALLIGIENYPQPEEPERLPDDAGTTLEHWVRPREVSDPPENPDGALHDVEEVHEYLRERGVPESQILILKDDKATRANMLSAFQHHLINNPDITRDDPILFYYSGHGCRGPAPDGWAAALEGDDSQIEYMVPYDSVGFGQLGKPGIPDRTTRALIHELAQRKGRNVSVVLDCCHSGHGVRKVSTSARDPWRSRGVKAQHVGKLRPDTDREIWGAPEVRGAAGVDSSASFTERKRDDDTHVLLAACARLETSSGCEAFGGIFTNAWLAVLREGRARTYAETLAQIKIKLFAFYKVMDEYYKNHPELESHQRLEKQNPQCEGFNRDRHLFASTSSDGREFDVEPGQDDTECIIRGAGISRGVKQGTMFELRRLIADGEFDVLGSVVAQDVQTEDCIAKLPQDLLLPNGRIHAIVLKLSDPVTVDTTNLCPESAKATEAFELLNRKLAAYSPYYRRGTDDKVDLVLEVDDDYVHFNRQDIRLRTIGTPPPKLPVDQIWRISEVMKAVAHFNYYLSFESGAHPFATRVEVRLHELERADVTYSADDFTFADPCRNMKAGDPVPFENGEALILHEHDEQLYALVLRSSTSQPLFPYILLFDPATYGIDLFAQPLNADDPALKPNLDVQFGRSSECEDALWFDLGEDNKKDTGYLKIILATEGNLNLSFMAQEAVLGSDLGDLSDAEERTMNLAGNAPQPMKGATHSSTNDP